MLAWLKTFFSGAPREPQMDSELRFHVDRLTDEYVADGLSPATARRKALLDFGGHEQTKEDLRDVHRIPILETAFANFKSALRFLRKSPTFSLAVILTLALGIGANSAVFSAIDAIVLRPLPFPGSDQLVQISQHDSLGRDSNDLVAPVRITDWNRLNSTFQAISGYY